MWDYCGALSEIYTHAGQSSANTWPSPAFLAALS